MKDLNMPPELRFMELYRVFIEWLCKTGNKHLIIPYSEFEPKIMDFLLSCGGKE